MSSNIRVKRICELCGNEFTARTTVTRFCGGICSRKAYKQKVQLKKIELSNDKTETLRNSMVKPIKDLKQLEFLNPTDASKLLQCSRVYIYELMDNRKLKYFQLSPKKRIIKRDDIDDYLNSVMISKKTLKPNPSPFDINNSFSMREAQQNYNISEKGLYELIKKHNIRKHRSGKFVLVESVELDKYLK